MICARGVVACLKQCGSRSLLEVQREGESSFTFELQASLSGRLVFWGSKTNRFLLGAGHERNEPSALFLIDLEQRRCKHLCSFAPGLHRSAENFVESFTCSGSGHTIAALVVPRQWRDRVSIHVASVKIRKQFVYNIRIFVRDRLPCFMGPLASILVSVRESGHVFRLGQEEPDGTMRFDGRACVGQVLPDDSPMVVTAVTHVHGSNTLLFLATDAERRSDTWWVLETTIEGETCESRLAFQEQVRAGCIDIAQDIGVGVTVYGRDTRCTWEPMLQYPHFYSMEFSAMRQSWIQACVRAKLL